MVYFSFRASLVLSGLLAMLLCAVQANAAESKRITLGYSSVGPMATGFWMAKEIGAFEKYGMHAEIIYISSGPVVIQALIGGDLQGGSAATNAVINAVLSGAPIIGVAGTSNRPYHRLYVQPEINRIEDLRGKVLGVTRFGSITDNLTRILLRKHKLENAVTVRQLGATAAVGSAFQQRVIAGAVTSDLRAGTQLPAKVLFNLADLGIPYSMQLITVARNYYRRNPEIVGAMIRAYAAGVTALHNQKEMALKVIAKYSRQVEAKGIEEHYRDSLANLDNIPRVEAEAITTILEFMGKPGIPHDTFFDGEIVERMAREGGP
jgi:NitT/TauT family transport system substrate-binding protein